MAKLRLRYKVPGKDETIEDVEDLNDAIKHWEAIWEKEPWVTLDECELEVEFDGKWVIWEDEDGWRLEEWLVFGDMDRAAKQEEVEL